MCPSCASGILTGKVDPEGNFSCYIDDLRFDIVENADLLNMKAVAGETTVSSAT